MSSRDVKKIKPDMTPRKEIDSDLLGSLRMLLLELRDITPFFGILASEMYIAGPSKSIPTIGVSPKGVVAYNEDFMRSLSPGERVAIFVHEALHVALDYWSRFEGLNMTLANWAHDFVINDIIVTGMSDLQIVRGGGTKIYKLDVKLPSGGAWSEKYRNMSGEEVYNILYKGVAERANQIKENYKATMADPAAKAAMERENQIKKELRISLQKGGKLLTEKEDEASSKTKVASDEIARENELFMEALRDSESKSLNFSGIGSTPEDTAPKSKEPESNSKQSEDDKSKEQKTDSPKESQPQNKDEPQTPEQETPESQSNDEPQSSNAGEPDEGQEQSESNEHQPESEPGQGAGEEQSADGQDSQEAPGQEQGAESESGQGQESTQPGSNSQASSDAARGKDAADVEAAGDDNSPGTPDAGATQGQNQGSPSSQPQAGQPESGDGNPYQQAKSQMQEAMGEAFNDYMDREKDRITNEVDGTPDGTTREQHLDELSEDLDKISDQYVDDVTKAREQGHEEPEEGQSQDGEQNPGEGDPKEPGDKPGEKGEGGPQEGQEGEGAEGQGAPGDESQSSQGKPGQSGSGAGGQPSSDGKSGQEAGQPGGNGPISEKAARQDVQNSMQEMIEQLKNSLAGKPEGGMKGLDQQMASGEQVIDSEGFDQAMRELADELGSSMDGDVDMDCSDIENNPFRDEKPEQTDDRRRQMLTRAVIEDHQQGGKAAGNLPGWMQAEINKILYPPLSFAQELEKFVGPYGATTQRSFSVRNKRNTFLPNHMIRPGMKKNTSKVYILLDTSGSMMNGRDAENLAHAMGLVDQLATALRMEVEVIQCDVGVTKILSTQEAMEEVRQGSFKVDGIGGSDLNPAFEHIWQEMIVQGGNRGNPIICFTDGEIRVPDEVPAGLRQQCLWVTNPGQRPPTTKWGEHTIMRDM